jgi:hypothetical protein
MRPSDLRPAAELAANKPHGHKMRYMAGCRCELCRKGNAAYEAKMQADRLLYGPNDLVPTTRVLEHIRYLQEFGMGHKTVAKHAKVSKTSLAEIIWYGRKQIRRRAENRVLSVQPSLDTLPRFLKIPAEPTLVRIRQLTLWGLSHRLIARDALANRHALQVHALKRTTKVVAVKTAVRIRDFYSQVQRIRELWRSSGQTIPRGHFVYWKTSDHSLSLEQIELRHVAVNHDYFHKYSPDLKQAMRAANVLKYSIRERNRREKQDR